METGTELLRQVGFIEVGEWGIVGESLKFVIRHGVHGPEILYSFVCGDQVLYLGKSTRRLDERMQNYKTPGSVSASNRARTNVSNNQRIRDVLCEGKNISIWVMAQFDPLEYHGVRINVAAGIEDALVSALRPPWNGSTKLK